jgi:hypothetical protein
VDLPVRSPHPGIDPAGQESIKSISAGLADLLKLAFRQPDDYEQINYL